MCRHPPRRRHALSVRSGENADGHTQPTTERSGKIRYALVHLGVCSAPVAHALAIAITNGLAR
ncbi:hypothetical protein [Streptomyces sp. SID14515]|uniref:hypothetical protein n=1 Tax=Streptomyces sp. SID14515 TaxID=2706074 RepID=UPI001EF2C604|nr:hypothetical protein [Streptomyces sp. SID14515]